MFCIFFDDNCDCGGEYLASLSPPARQLLLRSTMQQKLEKLETASISSTSSSSAGSIDSLLSSSDLPYPATMLPQYFNDMIWAPSAGRNNWDDLDKSFDSSQGFSEEVSSDDEAKSAKKKYTTVACRMFRDSNDCTYGDECKFSHVIEEAKKKKKLCEKFVLTGYCKYGKKCSFLHRRPAVLEAICHQH